MAKKQIVKETVAEFLARGGQVSHIKAQPSVDEPNQLKHKALFTVDSISLGDGGFYFAEKRSKAKNVKALGKFKKKLDKQDLPENLKQIIEPALVDVEPEIKKVEQKQEIVKAKSVQLPKMIFKFDREKVKNNRKILEKKRNKR